MSDLLMEMGQRPAVRRLIKNLGLPVPLPQTLARSRGGYVERPLDNQVVVFGAAPGARLVPAMAQAVIHAGADPVLAPGASDPVFDELAEAYGRPARALDTLPEGARVHGLVYDATGIATPEDLRRLFDFFGPLIRSMRACGRVVVLGRDVEGCADEHAAAGQSALEGFVRSVAKEVGKRGVTANLVRVLPGAEGRLAGPLRFLLSRRSAFVDGQPVVVSTRAAAQGEPAWTQALDKRVALVTGAARGIGQATAQRLAEEGAHVVCLDRPEDETLVTRVAHRLGGSTLLADMADPDTPARIVEALKQAHGGVDVVVHNAGITRDKTLGRMDADRWDAVLTINLVAVQRTTRALLDAGLVRDAGRLIGLSSIAGIAGNVGQTNYAASKAGVMGWVRGLSGSLAERGITVNAVAPGFIETRMTAAVPMMIREAGRRLSSLGQGGLPVDVAEAITFLATPGAAGLTGQVLRVCGGGFLGA